jgi:hypothetical protein
LVGQNGMAKKIEVQDWQYYDGGHHDKTRLLADGYDLPFNENSWVGTLRSYYGLRENVGEVLSRR